MKNNLMNRREIVAGSAALALIGMSQPSFALSGKAAESLIDKAVGEINSIIASGRSQKAMLRDFERTFARYADVNIVALTTLGPARRSATKAQLRAYTKAFQGYFSQKYGSRFGEFVGGKIEVKGSRPTKSNVEVKSIAKLRNKAPFEVLWLVSDRSGSPKIFNMVIAGVNMLTAERTEIGAMLDRRKGNIDKLTADLAKLG